MPNVIVALPNTGGALCSTPQSLADAYYYTYDVSKNVPPLASYNFDAHEWILIFLAEMLPIK